MNDYVKISLRPPFVYVFGILISIFLKFIFPDLFIFQIGFFVSTLSYISIVLGILVLYWGWKSLLDKGVDPNFKSVKTFVTEGAFCYSRNPIYIGFTLLYIGISFLLKTFVPFLLFPFIIVYINILVINKEEEYLLKKFGKQYNIYKKNVRRWI